jgi:hypothetical protein
MKIPVEDICTCGGDDVLPLSAMESVVSHVADRLDLTSGFRR